MVKLIIENTDEESKLLTDEEFDNLIQIHRSFLDRIEKLDWNNYKLSLSYLDDKTKEIVEFHRQHIITKINKSIDDNYELKSWRYGAIRFKDIFWKAHHFAILPIIYKDYLKFSPKQIVFQFTDENISEYIFNNYPFIKQSLQNVYSNYCDLRKELKDKQLAEKLGYGGDLPNPSKIQEKFTLNTIKELLLELKSNSAKKEALIKKIFDLKKQGIKQIEIAKEVGLRQGSISKILKKGDNYAKPM